MTQTLAWRYAHTRQGPPAHPPSPTQGLSMGGTGVWSHGPSRERLLVLTQSLLAAHQQGIKYRCRPGVNATQPRESHARMPAGDAHPPPPPPP
ncbi:hypothetical protein E2C01_023912 [Portunus trituberculatus]|uniref:Uncharacterized protein n=1 Tax=Portunus trituberculatus TaxID=210409 RepID=A0A5B7ECZ4_PORTR|nr:hypothetical protein [Portunus trituberculatus]